MHANAVVIAYPQIIGISFHCCCRHVYYSEYTENKINQISVCTLYHAYLVNATRVT